MRTVETFLGAALVGAALLAVPAIAFDGSKSNDVLVAASPSSAMEAFRSGTMLLKSGDTAKALHSLQYAAEQGHPLAQWKLGRMYADGDGVAQDEVKAFDYFRRIADSHAEDSLNTPQARFVANAFVAL